MRLALSLPGVKLAYCGHSIPIYTSSNEGLMG